MSDPVVAVRMQAFSVAMRAKVDALPRGDVALMRVMAEKTLQPDDPLRSAVAQFAELYAAQRFDRDVLYDLGVQLQESVRLHCLPTPIDAARVDIYG